MVDNPYYGTLLDVLLLEGPAKPVQLVLRWPDKILSLLSTKIILLFKNIGFLW